MRRGIIIGQINDVADTQYGRALSLRQSGKKYYASAQQIDAAATIEFSIKHDNRFDAGALYL